jgi:CII-binding regulator of phage lambda lysogenization HflD
LKIEDETLLTLQDNMNEMNLNLLTIVQRLEDKEKLIQNLQSQISKLQGQLESEVMKKSITFIYFVYHKIYYFKIEDK